MQAHPLFGEMGIWIGLLLGSTLVVVVAASAVSFFRRAPRIDETATDEKGVHGHPPIPIVLKILYVVFALWAVGYILWFVLTGTAI